MSPVGWIARRLSLIPYFEIPVLSIGPLEIQPFGVLAALGVYSGARIAESRARKMNLDPRPMAQFAMWALLGGIVGGHLVHLLFYHPEELSKSPWQLLRFWDGLSSFGGLLGGIIATAVWFRVKKKRFSDYSDALALGVAPGWAIARVGCFVVHDHPGVPTDFFLAVAFPGGARHDLGLYDALLLFGLTAVVHVLHRRQLLSGLLLPVLAVGYGIGRFFFDFLRASDLAYVDARYFGLTPGQYFCVILAAWGGVKLTRALSLQKAATTPNAGS